MRKILVKLFFALTAVLFVVGCKEKKETNVILTSRPVEIVKEDTVKMEEMNNVSHVKWQGAEYDIQVLRKTDTSLPITEDEAGNMYYDNKITLKITNENGSVFLEKTFSKSDFKNYVSDEFFAKKALVGLVFDKVDGGILNFAASVGSPDRFSDDFIPFDVKVSSTGGVLVKLSEQNLVDTDNKD